MKQLFLALCFLSFSVGSSAVIGFLFFEKTLERQGDQIKLKYRLLFLPLWQKTILLPHQPIFYVEHFLDSPNMAKISQDQAFQAFQNRGYYQLFALGKDGRTYVLDRHSRKADLEKLAKLLDLKNV